MSSFAFQTKSGLTAGGRKAPASVGGAPSSSDRRTFDRSGPPLTVLIVDDDVDARFIYSTYLRAMGCIVITARNGRLGIQHARDFTPDVIVMDLVMPLLDGFEAIRQVRDSSWTRNVAIVVLSAAPETRDAAFVAGCDAYLTKPCVPDVLWAQIQALMRFELH